MGEPSLALMKTNLISNTLIAACILTSVAQARTVPTHASADLVLGQSDFTSSFAGSDEDSLYTTNGIAIDPTTGKVFVSDEDNHRVLRFASAESLTTGAAAEIVLGQDGFENENLPTTSSQGMDSPTGLFVDHLGRLWVADHDNARVLRFSNASTLSSHAAADRVYGQPDFTTSTFNVTASGMINPTSVWVDRDDRLWVADESSCRILRFDDISNKPSGASADGVLGQANFTSGTQGSGATGLDRPMSIVISKSGALFVACNRGHRVLRFDQAATLENGAAASAVFGQADFSGATSGVSATSMNNPRGLAIAKDDTLWVCDTDNSRVLRFDKASTRTNGAAANGVIGQPDFASSEPGCSAQSLSAPEGGMAVDSQGDLWITDRSNNRALRFPAVVSKPLLAVTSELPKNTGKKSITIRGNAADPNGISRVRYQLGDGAWKTASGTTKWKITPNLKKGENTIRIIAEDPWGDLSRRKVIKITRK